MESIRVERPPGNPGPCGTRNRWLTHVTANPARSTIRTSPALLARHHLSSSGGHSRARHAASDDVQQRIDALDQDELTAADTAHRLECPYRILEVDDQRATRDDVEPAVRFGVKVIDRQRDPLGPRAERRLRLLETPAAGDAAPAILLGPRLTGVIGPVERSRIVDVHRHYFARAEPLHLERPEAVERADIQAAPPG